MKIHIVKSGDTLYELSKKYNVSLQKIIEANPGIQDPNKLLVGMKVKIPVEAKPVTPEYEMMHKHVVKQGDTLWKLSKAWGIPLEDMIKANPQLKNPNELAVGEFVFIPKVGGGMMPNIMPTPYYDGYYHDNKIYTGPAQQMPNPNPNLNPMPNPIPNPSPMPNLMHGYTEAPHQPWVPYTPNISGASNMPNVSAMPNMPNMSYEPMSVEMSEELFSHFQVPATEAISLYDLPQIPEIYPMYQTGCAPEMPIGAYENCPPIHPCGHMVHAQHDYVHPEMHMPVAVAPVHGYPHGFHDGANVHGIPNQAYYNPYMIPYTPELQGVYAPQHDCGCGCREREQHGAALAEAPAPVPVAEAIAEVAKTSEHRSAPKSKSRNTSSKKSGSGSTERAARAKKSRSLPWING